MLSPIHTLPIEILSYIFQQLVYSVHYDHWYFNWYEKCRRQAFVLGSVSSHFRHVAFGTPELWKRIPLLITNGEAIGKASSLLQHCITLAPSVSISVAGTLDEEETCSAIDILLTPDTMRKVKSFELYESIHRSDLWIDKFNGSCVPMLDTLRMACDQQAFTFDLGMLTTVTRLRIHACYLDLSTILPPSVQYLSISDLPQQMLVSLLYQCPNLVECTIDVNTNIHNGLGADTQFTKPLTFAHLKHLTSTNINAIMMNSSVENLRLPSLEFLELECSQGSKFLGVIPLCRNVSATLTTLIIGADPKEFTYDDMFQLWRIPFPKLKKLEFYSLDWACFLRIIRALALLEASNDSNPHYCPALRSITLRCSDDTEPRSIVDLLKGLRIGEVFYLHIKFRSHSSNFPKWPSKLREELRPVLGSRQVEVTWNNDKV
jgi:hypothetical protein